MEEDIIIDYVALDTASRQCLSVYHPCQPRSPVALRLESIFCQIISRSLSQTTGSRPQLRRCSVGSLGEFNQEMGAEAYTYHLRPCQLCFAGSLCSSRIAMKQPALAVYDLFARVVVHCLSLECLGIVEVHSWDRGPKSRGNQQEITSCRLNIINSP